jgi:hypothetical protein
VPPDPTTVGETPTLATSFPHLGQSAAAAVSVMASIHYPATAGETPRSYERLRGSSRSATTAPLPILRTMR